MQHDGVAGANVLAGDLVFIVQRGAGDGHAADGDGCQPRDGGQCAGAADLDVDRLQHCCGLFGGEFPRDRPAGCAAGGAQAALQGQAVDFVDHAIDLVRQRRAHGCHLPLKCRRVAGAGQGAIEVADGKAPATQPIEEPRMRIGRRLTGVTHCIGEELYRALGGDACIQLP